MIILVDVGNTRTKYVIGELTANNLPRIIENNKITSQWLTQVWGGANNIIIASVVFQGVNDLICDWARHHHKKLLFVNSETERFGVTNSYQQPKTLGVDRWLALLGAAILYPKTSVVIIDAGTATTVDVLDCNGTHQGGWILAGVDLLLSSLRSSTSKVKFELSHTITPNFGKSTSACVNNAAWAATTSLINTGIEKAQNEFNIQYCFLLGGNAERLLPYIEFSKVKIINDLIFHGLKRYSTIERDNLNDIYT